MVSDSERTKILEMIESGTITAEEGLTLLKALDESGVPDFSTQDDFDDESIHSFEPEGNSKAVASEYSEYEEHTLLPADKSVSDERDETIETYAGEVEVMPSDPAQPGAEEIQKWKRWWVIPLWLGVGITVIGGLLMYWAFSANGFGFWFACAWFPFLVGVALLALAWSSRAAPWIHVRVHQAPGEKPQKIAISFPIPVRLTSWGLRTFGHHIPHMEDINLDEMILALKDVSKDETPLIVDVDEGEDGERVQVFIG